MKKLLLLYLIFLPIGLLMMTSVRNKEWKVEQNLISNWVLTGAKSIATQSKPLNQDVLRGKNMLKLTYDLNGLCLLDGDASAIHFQQKKGGQKYTISLAKYGKNCYSGLQTVDIPLSHFEGLDISKPVELLTISFWYPTHYEITIQKALVYYSKNAVLGESTPPRKLELSKQFPNMTPIRPFPYAATNSAK